MTMDDWGDWGTGGNDGGGSVSDNKATKSTADSWGNTTDNTSKSGADGWANSTDNTSKSGADGWGISDNNGSKSGSSGSHGGCYNCGGQGHMSRDCPEPRKQGGGGGGGRNCYNCGGDGHMSRDCPEPKKQGGGGGGGRNCYNCGGDGHMSRDCPEPKKQGGGGGGGRSCYNCGRDGHMSRDCPDPRKQGGARNNESSGGGGGGGGWDSSNGNNSKSDAGGWGAPKSDAGGWGAPKSDAGGRVASNDDAGGWSASKDESFKPDAAANSGEGERPAPYRPEELNLDEEAKLQVDNVGENFKRYKDQKVTCIPLDIIKPIEKFEDVIESKLLLENVKSLRYTEMTPIQKWAMPAIVEGYDLIGCAQTGSGKTAAFLLPILQTIMRTDLGEHNPDEDCQNPHCIIISPTRELAKQIYTQSKMLSKDSLVKSCYIYGQISTSHLKSQLSRGCHILVATLGRLKDFVQRGWIGFKNTKYVILDEGDRLVDDGFSGDLKAIFEHETMPPKEERQILFFSATFKKQVQLTAKEFLRDEFIFITVGRVGAANEDIKQEFLQASRGDKKRELKKILEGVPDTDKTIIFTQTKAAADMLAGFFNSLKLSATSIHGDRHQSQREEAINLFKRGDKRFLISSPVGNRGLDLPKVSLVINYDLPDNIDEYVHRIGRTGRAGHTGRAISFFDPDRDREVVPDLLKILEEAKQEIPSWLREVDNPVGYSAPLDTETAGEDMNDDWGGGGSSVTAPQSSTISTGADEDWGASSSNAQSNSDANNDLSNGNGSNKRQATDEAGGPQKKVEKVIEPAFDQGW